MVLSGSFEQKESKVPVYKVNIKPDLSASKHKSTYIKDNLDRNLQIPEEEKVHHQSSKITEQLIELKKQGSDGNFEDSSDASDEEPQPKKPLKS